MYLLKSLYSWAVFLFVPIKWFCWRAGLLKRRPMFIDHYEESQTAWGQLTLWNPRLRVVGAENCPQAPPAIFAGNHIKLDDPFFAWKSAWNSSGGNLQPFFMMRDDYFHGFPWNLSPIPVIQIAEMGGGISITRENVTLSQMKPFLEILQRPGSFLLFPGRTRTRSGLVMEFREGVDEPGGVSFFLVHGQRRTGKTIPCVPFARTHDVITHKSAVVLGVPRFLAPNATREEQRAFDFDLAAAIGSLIEIKPLHLISGLLYLHALHHRGETVTVLELLSAVKSTAARLPQEIHRDPAFQTFDEPALRRILKFLARRKMLSLEGGRICLNATSVLAVPELDTRYLKNNPFKYHVNQILHLASVVKALEDVHAGAL